MIPKLDVISACEDLAAAEYELADDEDRNYLLKKYINNIQSSKFRKRCKFSASKKSRRNRKI